MTNTLPNPTTQPKPKAEQLRQSFIMRQRAPLLIVSLVGVAGSFVYLKARAVKQRSEEAKRASSKDRFIVTTARSGGGI